MSSAAKVREFRRRQSEGIVLTRMEITGRHIELLIEAGWLPAWDEPTGENVAKAFYRYLDWLDQFEE